MNTFTLIGQRKPCAFNNCGKPAYIWLVLHNKDGNGLIYPVCLDCLRVLHNWRRNHRFIVLPNIVEMRPYYTAYWIEFEKRGQNR